MLVPVVENVLKLNDEMAAINRKLLKTHGVLTLDLIGAPGSGKTALIEATIPRMPELKFGVICGDLATQRDADRLALFTPNIVQVNTGKGCHLEANHVHQALQRLDLGTLDILFIENVGNLICPVGFDLGQDMKVGVFNVAGGDDKPAKHPYLVREAQLLVLTQIDLMQHMNFRRDVFMQDVQELHPGVNVLELSPRTGEGFERWVEWLQSRRAVPAA
jgi:hydrogenase nickel incorporation protein HypB